MLPSVDCKRTDVTPASLDSDAMAPCPVCFEKLRRSSLHSSAISALNLARAAACVLTAAGSIVVAVAPATAADTAIYKCFDNHLGLVYTDLPCKDGEKLDIRAGDADPAAVARLERMRDQLDQSAARRIVDDRRDRKSTRLNSSH